MEPLQSIVSRRTGKRQILFTDWRTIVSDTYSHLLTHYGSMLQRGLKELVDNSRRIVITKLAHWVCNERNQMGVALIHLPFHERTCSLNVAYIS